MATKYRFDICAAENTDGSNKVLLSCTFEAEDTAQAEEFKKATLEAWAKVYPFIDIEAQARMSIVSNQ